MTTTLIRPSPRELLQLRMVRDYPAVSVLMTTTPADRMTYADATRLRGLVAQTVDRLRAEPGLWSVTSVLEGLGRLAERAAAAPTSAAVALFASSQVATSLQLPVAVRDRVVVDPTFATRDLVRALHRTPRHAVLVLTLREARLFDGGDDALTPAGEGLFPRHEIPAARSAGRADRSSRRQSPDHTAFLRQVDRALGAYLRRNPAPLVLVGEERTVASFRRLSRHTGRLAGEVYGSHASTAARELIPRIRGVLDDYLRSRQREALDLLDRRAGASRVVSGMRAAWLAARTERPELLAVEEGLFYPARLHADGDLLEPADDVDHPDVVDDVVDELIETVLLRDGWVAMVADRALAEHEGVALTLRG